MSRLISIKARNINCIESCPKLCAGGSLIPLLHLHFIWKINNCRYTQIFVLESANTSTGLYIDMNLAIQSCITVLRLLLTITDNYLGLRGLIICYCSNCPHQLPHTQLHPSGHHDNLSWMFGSNFTKSVQNSFKRWVKGLQNVLNYKSWTSPFFCSKLCKVNSSWILWRNQKFPKTFQL